MSTPVETSVRARLLLAAAGVLAALVLAELALFPLLLPHTPLRLHVFLPDGVRVLAQSSKDAREPARYVAIAGDSYAQGRGDWLLGQDPDGNGPFHSAHVIHARTGRDVLSVARGGTGAVRGTVEAQAGLRYLQHAPRIGLPPPEVLFFYFYEGNDLLDTLLELLVLYGEGAGDGTDADALFAALGDGLDAFRGALEHPDFGDAQGLRERIQGLLARHPLARRAADPTAADRVPGLRTLWRMLRARVSGRPPGSPEQDVFPLWRQRPRSQTPSNVLRVGGQQVPLAVELQAPAPELRPRETEAVLWALEHALALLREGLPDTRVCVVYIPSPAASYVSSRPAVVIQSLGSRPDTFPADVVRARSDDLRARVGALARRLDLGFVDATGAVRRNARREMLHGPRDLRHFNERGYTVLGEVVAGHLAAAPPG